MLESFFIASLLVQVAHSLEELATGFHKKWFAFQMPFIVFLIFEVMFTSFFVSVLFNETFPFRSTIQAFFLLLMFLNGVQHVVWSACVRKYVPGLITAPFHIIVFTVFYFKVLL